MTYNLINQANTDKWSWRIYELCDVQWGKKTQKTYFVEKWSFDTSIDIQFAMFEKRQYKTKVAAMNKVRLELLKAKEEEA